MEWTWISDGQIWLSLLTLTVLEIVLGIDNLVFISILSSKVPKEQQAKARTTGLTLALITRILLLLSIVWLTKLTAPLFQVFNHGVSGKDLILIAGGLFLIWKSTHEIHAKLEGEDHEQGPVGKGQVSFGSVVFQILMIDIVFSLDSVITAVGMAQHVPVMVTAVVIALVIMLIAAGPISNFVERHPTVKMLALSFLLLIGVVLVADGWGQHIPKGYIYFAMAFSVGVEMLNLRMRKKSEPVHLKRGI
ncbi:MAG TPA: TerC family protein [Chthoniobacterales bacterium]